MAVTVGQRNVKDTPENNQLRAVTKAQALALHTIKIASNKNVFDEQYMETFTNKIINMATSIYLDCMSANNIFVDSEDMWKIRSKLQVRAKMNCNNMLGMIELSRVLYKLRGKKVVYWTNIVIETRNLIGKWHNSDKKRYTEKLEKIKEEKEKSQRKEEISVQDGE